MTVAQLYAVCGAVLFGLGFWALAVLPHLLRKVIGLNVMGAGVFLTLVALARRAGGPYPDPVPHAMVLTGLVVSISATGLALALIRRLYRETGLTELPRSTGDTNRGHDH